jgi:hypothetical protein
MNENMVWQLILLLIAIIVIIVILKVLIGVFAIAPIENETYLQQFNDLRALI